MAMTRKLLIAVGLWMLLLGRCLATTYYVDNSLKSSVNTGASWAAAWTNLSSISGIAAGDIIYISGGPSGSSQTYQLGSSSFPLVFGQPGSPVTYQIGQDSSHNGMAIFNSTADQFFGSGAANWIFSGDAGDGQRHFGTAATTNDNSNFGSIIYNMSDPPITNFAWRYVNFGKFTSSSNDAAVELLNADTGIEIGHCFFYLTNMNANDMIHLINLRPENYNYSAGQGGFIHDNVAYTPDSPGTSDVNGAPWCEGGGGGFIFSNNTCIKYHIRSYTGGHHDDHYLWVGGNNTMWINEKWYGAMNAAVFYTSALAGVTNIQFLNNLCVANGFGIVLYNNTTGSSTVFANCVIANNVITESGGPPDSYGVNIRGTAINTAVNCLFANNLLINDADAFTFGTGWTVVANTPFLGNSDMATNVVEYVAGQSQQNNTIYPANYDFHLKSNASTLIGHGTNLSSIFTMDAAGKTRLGGTTNNWDIGAFAY
jgi:hypothetical protein